MEAKTRSLERLRKEPNLLCYAFSMTFLSSVCANRLLMDVMFGRKMAFYILQKKYGLRKAGGERTGGLQPVFNQGRGTKRGWKKEAPAETEDGSKGSKKVKDEVNDGGCKSETGGEGKN